MVNIGLIFCTAAFCNFILELILCIKESRVSFVLCNIDFFFFRKLGNTGCSSSLYFENAGCIFFTDFFFLCRLLFVYLFDISIRNYICKSDCFFSKGRSFCFFWYVFERLFDFRIFECGICQAGEQRDKRDGHEQYLDHRAGFGCVAHAVGVLAEGGP